MFNELGMNRDKAEHYLNVPKRFIIFNTEGFEEAMRQPTNAVPEILYLKSSKYQKRSIAGDILDSEAVRADLDTFLTCDIL